MRLLQLREISFGLLLVTIEDTGQRGAFSVEIVRRERGGCAIHSVPPSSVAALMARASRPW
jgi:hypothetical protein